MIHVLDHGHVLASPVAKKQKLLCDERSWHTGQARVLPLLAALAEFAVAAGADFVDLLPVIEIGILEAVRCVGLSNRA